MPTIPKKRPGRPAKPDSERTGNFSVRMPVELRDRLESAAAEAGRSVNAEIAWRLELSFRMEGHQAGMEELFGVASAQRQAIDEKIAELKREGAKVEAVLREARRLSDSTKPR